MRQVYVFCDMILKMGKRVGDIIVEVYGKKFQME